MRRLGGSAVCLWGLVLGLLPSVAAASNGQIAGVAAYEVLTADDIARVSAALESMKRAARGPYARILWFCNDGVTRTPQQGNCRDHGGGHQRAELSQEASALGSLGFHPGSPLMALSYEDFVDGPRAHYRLREWVVEDFLLAADDGWVLRRARYYRGARQVEDEEQRGRAYLEQLFGDAAWRARSPLLAARLVATVPHGQPGVPGERIRRLAEEMGALEPRLQDLRIKIHSRPGPGDLAAVRSYRDSRSTAMSPELDRVMRELESALVALYLDRFDAGRWAALRTELRGSPLADALPAVEAVLREGTARSQISALARLQRDARASLDRLSAGAGRATLAHLDLIHYADTLLKAAAGAWIEAGREPRDETSWTRVELLTVAYDLVDAAFATGWLSPRERGFLTRNRLDANLELAGARYRDGVTYLANAIDWSQGALRQGFGAVLERYRAVEPAVSRFEDDLIRGSVLLPLANVLDLLGRDADLVVGMQHSIFDLRVTGRVVGLNSGLAVGPLGIIDHAEDLSAMRPEGIYVIPETQAEIGRVAGILTLQEGSRLSHVQLLARSLGIPNAAISPGLMRELRAHEGQDVFYAVSAIGTVVLKRRSDISEHDLLLLAEGNAAPSDLITIDESRLDLQTRRVLALPEVELADSGRLVGPKAANVAELRRQFPDRVAPGVVIPFGVFRAHIDRDLLGTGRSLYEDLVGFYRRRAEMESQGVDPTEAQTWLLARLREVREAIQTMGLLPEFEAELREVMAREFGPDGTYGVFVRSDTNVEDLPNFTGAGLNLTVMNQITDAAILHALKQVWASPFSDRSFTWRQQLLTNPEHVYPSILLLKSVPVEASGVLATIDLTRQEPGLWTVTLSEGIGGVVDGEPAETTLVPAHEGEPLLLSSARAVWQKTLRMTGAGGIERIPARGESELLTTARLRDLRLVVDDILTRYTPVYGPDGDVLPWDIEFGFLGDRVALFQIRPLVTNRRVRTLRILSALDAGVLADRYAPVRLDQPPRQQ